MHTIEELLENYGNSQTIDFRILNENEIIISDLDNVSLKLSREQLIQIVNGEKATILGLDYLNDYGIQINSYAELFIESVHDDLSSLLFFGNEELDLSFLMDKVEINVSRVSNILSFILNGFYSKRYYHVLDRGLQENYFSLKLKNINKDNYKKYAQEALFYINSDYIKKIINPMKFYRLDPDYIDPLLSDDNEEIKIDISSVNRKRILSRPSFKNLELIQLYNYALTLDKYNKFINIYRIIEFYYPTARNLYLDKYRQDSQLTNEMLIKAIDRESELKNLQLILELLLTEAEKKHLIELYFSKKFIKEKNLEKFAVSLYQYRNSIVHSKSTQINTTIFQDPFTEDSEIASRNYSVEYIAKKIIKRFNVKS